MAADGRGWRARCAAVLSLLSLSLSLSLSLAPVALASSSLPSAGARFKYRSYAENVAYLLELNASFPEVLRVSVAQETYGLPYPDELMCVVDDATGEEEPCKQFLVHLTNHSTLATDTARPEVFLSGALHGNERVGPIATVELLALMAKLSTWHAHPEALTAETNAGATAGVSRQTMRWVHELVNSRSVLVTPMTNAWGFAHDKREELGVDPNRDYNYMRDGDACMTAMTSRVVNEIWRDHVFQMAITFHGGTRAVSYEWGSPDHYLKGDSSRSEKSPDHTAQFQLANTFATFAGAFADGQLYPTGTMNDIVYGVTGGMEDWAYAASWENDFYDEDKPFKSCKPATFGGYPENKTVYGNVTHRAFNMLVETSKSKEPKESELGGFDDLYRTEIDFFREADAIRVGHVTRNVRLALMMIEMVQPLVRWVDSSAEAFNQSDVSSTFPSSAMYVSDYDQLTKMGCGAPATSTLTPSSFSTSTSPPSTVACSSLNCTIDLSAVKSGTVSLQLAWEVLGALSVDKTNVQLATSPTFETESILLETPVMSGITRRFFEFNSDKKEEDDINADTLGTSMFMACFEFDQMDAGQVYVRAMAIVDQDWGYQGIGDDGPSPNVPPQSHMVNARTNPEWDMEWNGHRVKTSLEWFSPVMTVSFVGDAPTSTEVAGLIDAAGSTETDVVAGNETTDSVATDDLTDPLSSGETSAPSPTENATAVEPTSKPTWTSSTSTSTAAPMSIEETGEDDDDDDYDDLDAELNGDVEADVGETESEDSDDAEEDEDADDQTSVTPATASPAAAAVSADGKLGLNAQQETEGDSDDTSAEGLSLQEVGIMVLVTGAVVIVAIVALLYRRIFRQSRQPYESLNAPRASVQRRRRASMGMDDSEEEEGEKDEEDP